MSTDETADQPWLEECRWAQEFVATEKGRCGQEAEEFLSLLKTAGIEYEVAQDTDTPDSHFLV